MFRVFVRSRRIAVLPARGPAPPSPRSGIALFGFQLTVFVAIACYVSILTADGHSLFGAVTAALAGAIGAQVSMPKANIRPIVQRSA